MTKFGKNLRHIESMTSKVLPAADYWTVYGKKKWGRDCVIFGEKKNKERNGETPLRTGKYFEWIIKQLLNSAFVGYEEFCRSRRVLTLLDRQNSSYPTQPHSIIRRYSARLSMIIVLLFNKLTTKLVTFLNLDLFVDNFSLHFFFPRTKLHIPPDICYLRMTDIESITTIFG